MTSPAENTTASRRPDEPGSAAPTKAMGHDAMQNQLRCYMDDDVRSIERQAYVRGFEHARAQAMSITERVAVGGLQRRTAQFIADCIRKMGVPL